MNFCLHCKGAFLLSPYFTWIGLCSLRLNIENLKDVSCKDREVGLKAFFTAGQSWRTSQSLQMKSFELNWVKRPTSHEPNWLNSIRLVWSTTCDPGLSNLTFVLTMLCCKRPTALTQCYILRMHSLTQAVNSLCFFVQIRIENLLSIIIIIKIQKLTPSRPSHVQALSILSRSSVFNSGCSSFLKFLHKSGVL